MVLKYEPHSKGISTKRFRQLFWHVICFELVMVWSYEKDSILLR